MFDTKNILVIGDVMLDVYYTGTVNRISPEAPVPVFNKKGEYAALGGASNVASNLTAASQNASILAMIGDDDRGVSIHSLFAERGIDASLIQNWNRDTITKIRFLADNNQQVMRMDIEDCSAISEKQETELLQLINQNVDRFNLIILSDYMKGLLTKSFTSGVIEIANEHGIRVLVDVKDPDFRKYTGAWLLKPNLKELNTLTRMPVRTREEIVAAAKYLLREAKCEYVLTTCGARGMILVGKEIIRQLDTVGHAVYDVTGAGDTTIAYLAAGVASGLDIVEAMKISNYAAGIQVGKVGTSPVYLHEVANAISEGNYIRKKKVFRLNEKEEFRVLRDKWRCEGEKIVSTNGCFDILHKGHILLLEKAREYGDHLVVLINSDASVKRLKGEDRPVNNEEDRAMVIAALDCVDAVVIFDPLTDNSILDEDDWNKVPDNLREVSKEAPMGIMKQILPDVHVKGGDYNVSQVPEAMFADSFVTVPYIEGYSTTKIIEKTEKSSDNKGGEV